MNVRSKPKLQMILAKTSGFSGQNQAAEIVMEIMSKAGWRVERVELPALARDAMPSICRQLLVVAHLGLAWAGSLRFWPRRQHLMLNLGQTAFSMVRAGVVFRMMSLANHRSHRIISLHGSVFMGWTHGCREAKLLRFICSRATKVTVLGPNQAKQLERLGIPSAKIVVVPNTCLLDPISTNELAGKFGQPGVPDSPIRTLFLSNLIPSKGYPTYLEALELISRDTDGPRIEAVLCGPLHQSDFGGRFKSLDEAEQWIDDKLAAINKSSSVRAEWIRGARGDAKQKLFREAHIFVMPTDYAVEAQPLVVIEAMASGCAVITSDRGEIPFMMDGRGVVLHDLSPKTVAESVRELARNPQQAEAMSRDLHQLFHERYSYEQHAKTWRELYGDEDA